MIDYVAILTIGQHEWPRFREGHGPRGFSLRVLVLLQDLTRLVIRSLGDSYAKIFKRLLLSSSTFLHFCKRVVFLLSDDSFNSLCR